jgi:hypothetical protein
LGVLGIAKVRAEMFHDLLRETLGNNCEPALFDTLRDAIEHWYQLIAAA